MRLIVFSFTILLSLTCFSQETFKVSLTDYISEVQIWEKEQNNMAVAFWIPISYWETALKESPQISQETIDLITSAFSDYVFVWALDFDINLDGTMSFTEEPDIRKSISIEDSLGKIYYPLEKNQIEPDLLTLTKNLEPMFAKVMGQMGSGLYCYFFKIKDDKGNNLINEYNKGNFTVKHSAMTFEFQTPVVALLPPKNCPVDNAEMKGNWIYCPIHGAKL